MQKQTDTSYIGTCNEITSVTGKNIQSDN